jgi:mannosylglycerate hydrolase
MRTLHIVPHTHWDREWYLPFQSFRIKLIHLIDVLLDILDRDPAYAHFTLDGQTIILEDYLEIRPEREADLIRHIRSGRLIIGPWYILPDEFLVSPEATVRNLLIGESACNCFGARMDIGYLPDPFGHIGQMPQILQGFGIESAIFRRGLSDEPCELRWQSPDGSSVFVSYLRDGYDNIARLPTEPTSFLEFIESRYKSLAPHSSISHLLLLNGTDHHEPQPQVPSLISTTSLPDTKLVISSFPAYITAALEEITAQNIDLPIVHGELRDPKRHHLLPGVLSSRVWIKQRNHTCETLLERWTEPFSVWADLIRHDEPDRTLWTGHLTTPRVRNPEGLINHAWKILLQCHPHDSICGCSVDQVHEEMRDRFDQVEQIGEEITRQSLLAITGAINTSSLKKVGSRSALVVFNPNPNTCTELAEAKFEMPAGLDPFEIVDEQGQIIPYRILDREERSIADMELDAEGLRTMLASVQNGHVMGLSIQEAAVVKHPDYALIDVVFAEGAEPNIDAMREASTVIEKMIVEDHVSAFRLLARFVTEITIQLVASDIPGHGYRAFGLRSAVSNPSPAQKGSVQSIENGLLQVEAQSDGSLSVKDLRTGIVFDGLLKFSDQADRGDSYNFCPLEGDEPIETPISHAEIHRFVDESGEILEIDSRYQIPESLEEDRTARSDNTVDLPIRVRARLVFGIPRVDIEITLENHADDHRLQAHFQLPFEVSEADYDGHYEIVRRSTRLPDADSDWAEQPVHEVPMRNFVAVRNEEEGLMISTRGLREASVSPDGMISITLLRCFGWLSRPDLATRKGGAGPQLPTPGGQEHGDYSFHLSLIPFNGDLLQARLQAEAFQTALRGMGTSLHPGALPPAASLVNVDHQAFALTSLKSANDGDGLILRGVNLSHQTLKMKLRFLFPIQSATKVRMDETKLESIEIREGHHVHLLIKPHEILTLHLTLSPMME